MELVQAIAAAAGEDVIEIKPGTTAAFFQEGVPSATDGDAVESVLP